MPAITQVKNAISEVMEQRDDRGEARQEAADLAEGEPLVDQDQHNRQDDPR